MHCRTLALWLFASVAPLCAQSPIDPLGVPGTRIIVGGGKLTDAIVARFVELAGGDQAKIVLVPTASARADEAAEQQKTLELWQQRAPRATVTVLHTRDRSVADSEAFCAPLQTATALWFGGGAQKRIADVWLDTRAERELYALLRRGGVVGGTSAGAAIQSKTMIQEGNPDPVIARGFDLVPFGIVDQHFGQRNRLARLLTALTAHPGHLGIGIDESTAVELSGRRLTVHGNGTVRLVLAAAAGRDERVVELRAGDNADLVAWQRAARDRTLPPWPPTAMAEPRVPAGALVIVGGGRLPAAVVQKFVQLAGGKDARVALVTGAAGDGDSGRDPFAAILRRAGISDLRTVACTHPAQVDDAALRAVADATAVWFGGGRQWRLCDAFAGTAMPAAFAAVLARGGVIGGSSAGATIQGEFLVRGNPLGNTDMWCEGYDRGFAFLPGCAIDQHFLARKRTPDLQALIGKLPQLVGLGIDEGTAAIVQGNVMEVVGDSTVSVFDVRSAMAKERATPQPVQVGNGQRWDLVAGKML
ncbi:MAG: cyanophycinase [Planctomycetes bacterium]|nr:cyanophycinase [Planctomycetota bacterium]